MKVMVIVKASAGSEAGEMPSSDLLSAMGQYNQALANAGILLAGEGLQPSIKGVRIHFSGHQRTVTDGPFAETKELVAGFWLWQVQSMQEAIDWVKRCPNPMNEDSDIEIRPLFEADDFGEAFTPELREQEASNRAQALGLGSLRYENSDDLYLAGLNQAYDLQTRSDIPAQWNRFMQMLDQLPQRKGIMAYGICWNNRPGCGFDYLCGIEVHDSACLPADFTQLQLTAQRYAVFKHDGHVSSLSETLATLWRQWAPNCSLQIADAPWFERYTHDFNPQSGRGGIEIWIPINAAVVQEVV